MVYGPGRESGVSAGPSLACRAAVRQEPYVIGFTGETGLVYVEDAAAAFEAALLSPREGAHVYNLVGDIASVDTVIEEIQRQVPGAVLHASGGPLTINPRLDEQGLDAAFPDRRRTSLREGLKSTLAHYAARV